MDLLTLSIEDCPYKFPNRPKVYQRELGNKKVSQGKLRSNIIMGTIKKTKLTFDSLGVHSHQNDPKLSKRLQ